MSMAAMKWGEMDKLITINSVRIASVEDEISDVLSVPRCTKIEILQNPRKNHE